MQGSLDVEINRIIKRSLR